MVTTKKYFLANALILISALGFSFGGFFIKYVPWHAMSISASRNLIAFLIMLCYLIFTKHKIVFNKNVAFTAVASCLTCTLFCIATKLTTAANAIVLQYTSPIFAIIICAVGLRALPKRRDLITCICVFAGILCFFINSFSGGANLGNMLALFSGFTYALVFMSNTIPKNDSLSAFMFGQLLSGVIGLPFLFKETIFVPSALLGVLALGLILGIGYIMLGIGLKTTPPLAASLLTTIEPILNPVWVAILYGEMLSVFSIIGFVVVLASLVYYSVSSAISTQNKP